MVIFLVVRRTGHNREFINELLEAFPEGLFQTKVKVCRKHNQGLEAHEYVIDLSGTVAGEAPSIMGWKSARGKGSVRNTHPAWGNLLFRQIADDALTRSLSDSADTLVLMELVAKAEHLKAHEVLGADTLMALARRDFLFEPGNDGRERLTIAGVALS